jgi:hypothetical protein
MFRAYAKGTGRIFGCVPGHHTWTFDDSCLQVLVLRDVARAEGQDPYRFDSLVQDGARVE